MLTDNWVIHVGYPRAGSTWLQNNFFPFLLDVEFIGTNSAIKKGWSYELRFLFNDTNFVDFCPLKIRDFINKNTQEIDSNKTWIWSCEALIGFYKKGFQNSRINADNLKLTFGNVKIIIVIRNQIEHLKSLYRHYLKWGGITSLDFLLAVPHSRNAEFKTDDLIYHKLIKYYIDIFGESNVLIIPFELLIEDQEKFVIDICNFIDCSIPSLDVINSQPQNEGIKGNFCHYVRLLNYFTKTPFNPDGLIDYQLPIFKKINLHQIAQQVAAWEEKKGINRSLLSQSKEEELKCLYRGENNKLQKLTKYNLTKYGYLM